MIEIVVYGKPMGKQRPRFSRKTGRAYTPAKTVAFEGRLSLEAQRAMTGRALFEGPLRVDIAALMPIAKSWSKKKKLAALAGELPPTSKPDFDNFAKVLDALNMVVWTDDALIVKGQVDKFYSEKPMFAVRVRPIVGLHLPPDWVRKYSDEGVFA